MSRIGFTSMPHFLHLVNNTPNPGSCIVACMAPFKCPRISTDNKFDKPVLSTPQATALMKLLRKENVENYFQIKHWL